MTATCHAGPPSWVKNSEFPLDSLFLVGGGMYTEDTGWRVLACMKLGPTPTRNLYVVLINQRIENSREGRCEGFSQPFPSLGY